MEYKEHISPHPLPDRGHPTRTVLPALTHFQFKGKSEYLEVLVAGIDAPLLDTICITFREIIFDIPKFAQFMRRATRFQELNETHVDFDYYDARVKSLPLTRTFNRLDIIENFENSGLIITCKDWSRVFASLFPSIYIVEHLYVYNSPFNLSQGQMEQLLEIFRPFTTVKKLYICKNFAQDIAPALVGERATDVLPVLESLFLEELQPLYPTQEAISQFVAARQVLGHPVAVSHWDGMTRSV
jgi:hypothetical protein